jgi:hypothetical protein
MNMDDFKSIFSSKTFWGGAMAVVAGILGVFGYTVLPEDQAALIDGGAAIAAAMGGMIAIWGRAVASKKIG